MKPVVNTTTQKAPKNSIKLLSYLQKLPHEENFKNVLEEMKEEFQKEFQESDSELEVLEGSFSTLKPINFPRTSTSNQVDTTETPALSGVSKSREEQSNPGYRIKFKHPAAVSKINQINTGASGSHSECNLFMDQFEDITEESENEASENESAGNHDLEDIRSINQRSKVFLQEADSFLKNSIQFIKHTSIKHQELKRKLRKYERKIKKIKKTIDNLEKALDVGNTFVKNRCGSK